MKQERRKITIQLAFWTWSWVLTLAIATFGPIYLWDDNKWISLLAIGVNLINGVLMIWANRRLFNHYDELERKIHLESLGFTLGTAVVVGLSYSLLSQRQIINANAEIGFLVGFIGVTYLIALMVNRKRYL